MEDESLLQPKRVEVPANRVEGREGKKTTFEKFSEVMALLSSEINSMVKKEYGLKKLVDDEGCIRMDRFLNSESGGIYSKEVIEEDQALVDGQNRSNSGADNPNTQEYFKNQYGISGTPESVVEQYLKNKNEHKSNQAEMAITALLHKVLKDRFIVVRASKFDDYIHGMDNLILDRETGAVICAFDEVLVNKSDDPATSKKRAKMEGNALANGKKAKYGIALEGGKLVRSEVENIPVFCLQFEAENLFKLATELHENFDKDVTKFERELFARLVASIEEQKKHLETLPLRDAIKAKLKAFEESLEVLKGYCGNI